MVRKAVDQAEGLRRMFADAARMVALFGDDEQEITAALALALAAQGKKILLLDEHLRAGDTHGLLPGPIRADIGHVLRGDKSLQEIVLQTSATGVTLMPAGVMRTVHKDSARVRLLAAFHALVGMFDIVLIRAATGNRPSFGFALGAPEAMVLCKGTSSGITAAYAQIKQAAHSPGSRHFRLLFRGVDAAMADVLFRNLAGVCRQHLNLMPDLAGVLPSDQTAAADAIEGLAAEIAHWPAPERDDSRFEAFMRRLLSVTGTFNPLTTEH